MSTEGLQGFYIETSDYRATADVWTSLGFERRFEADHGIVRDPDGRSISLQAPDPA